MFDFMAPDLEPFRTLKTYSSPTTAPGDNLNLRQDMTTARTIVFVVGKAFRRKSMRALPRWATKS